MKSKKFQLAKIFWGIYFIFAAAVVIMNQLGYLGEFNWFTILVTVAMIPIIIVSICHLNFGGILLPLAVVGILYAEPLGITALTPWPILGAALLVSIGLSILFHRPGRWRNHHWNEEFIEVTSESDGKRVSAQASFGSSIKYVNSENFEAGDFRCSFGEVKVYFDNAKVSSKGAVINVEASFGEVQLYFPRSWRITNNVNAFLGGVSEKNKAMDPAGPMVTLTGNVSFAGIEIFYI